MSKDKVPLLTIHVSVFNLEKYIEKCLNSILEQDFEDYELILVDNGSTDRSIEICQSYIDKYPKKIRYKKFPLPTFIGRPYTYARANIKGKYFMTVDGDDYITEGSLSRIAAIINEREPDVIMGTFIGDAEEGCPMFRDAKFDPQRINGVSYLKALEYLATIPNFHTVQWRYIVKDDILKISEDFAKIFADGLKAYDKLMNESTYGDLINVLNILSRANSMEFMKEPFYVYRSRSASLSSIGAENKKGIGFLTGLLTMKVWLGNDNNEKIESLIKAQLIKFCSLYSNVCTIITEDGYRRMAEIIDFYKNDFLRLKENDIAPLTELCNLVSFYGTHEGLLRFTELQEKKLFHKINPLSNKDIYVFPTGISGESTFELLKRWNLSVKGFLDNDPTKEALVFQAAPCMLPDRLNTFSEEQKENTVVVIATCYEYLVSILKDQLIALGMPENRIIIRE